ncbi:MAG: dTDP-4-dehydrorhamnose reductase [Anaerolineae bacterium]|nr:dTDP-4-dehydrorhamnose reductase [Anaerolineae bacterium]
MSQTVPNLVIGASGQVGEALMAGFAAQDQAVTGTYHHHTRAGLLPLDVRRAAQVDDLLRTLQPQTVLVPASLTNVDYCEQHPAEGYQTNVVGVQHLVQAANNIQAKLVYFSSDYIFDGQHGPYGEESPANPLNEYGRQKLVAEHLIALHAQNYLIIRTTVVYGWESQGKNFIYRLIKTLNRGDSIRVPMDQVGSPTYAPDLAHATIDLIKRDATGIYHIVGRACASRYDFALEAARVFDLNPDLIQPVQTQALNQIAPRPLQAGMIVTKIEQTLGRLMLDYKQGLRTMKEGQPHVT